MDRLHALGRSDLAHFDDIHRLRFQPPAGTLRPAQRDRYRAHFQFRGAPFLVRPRAQLQRVLSQPRRSRDGAENRAVFLFQRARLVGPHDPIHAGFAAMLKDFVDVRFAVRHERPAHALGRTLARAEHRGPALRLACALEPLEFFLRARAAFGMRARPAVNPEQPQHRQVRFLIRLPTLDAQRQRRMQVEPLAGLVVADPAHVFDRLERAVIERGRVFDQQHFPGCGAGRVYFFSMRSGDAFERCPRARQQPVSALNVRPIGDGAIERAARILRDAGGDPNQALGTPRIPQVGVRKLKRRKRLCRRKSRFVHAYDLQG